MLYSADFVNPKTIAKEKRQQNDLKQFKCSVMTDSSLSPLAHVRPDKNGAFKEHLLTEHLYEVKKLAGQFAQEFGNPDWAGLAGLWHDLGKFSPEFQKYLKSVSGYDPEAHIEGAPGKVNHSSAGALLAVEKLGQCGRILAYLIAGHHAGLPDWYSNSTGRKALSQRLSDTSFLENILNQNLPEDILNQEKPVTKPPGGSPALWIRMLFSCLVDADFLDTEKFMDPEKAEDRSNYPSIKELLPAFNRYMDEKSSSATSLNRIRSSILTQCRLKSSLPSGIFSLTVPTGGGKTLSSMAFALNHAICHDKKRVIYVIPYTSIIEQTANIFRSIFPEAVVEHHSNLDAEQETSKSRIACENWDAPIIVTTNVQFFESLFAVRTSRVRKLHNIINSVVILDEAQLLPPEFLKPILNVIQDLSNHYGVSFVISTATKPALQERMEFPDGLKNVRELIADPDKLHDDLKRTTLVLPKNFQTPMSWEEVAEKLIEYPTVLCVVNRRKDCRDLFSLIPEGSFHLSALMCGEHRSQILETIKTRLKDKDPVRVISTQLVEAGVDLDFPVVFRALAGLDSIAQAGGRCNREGELERGEVIVFVPPTPSPKGLLSKAEATARQLLQRGLDDPLAPQVFDDYFQEFYWKVNNLDKECILDDLKAGLNLEIAFQTAASKFRLIDERHHGQVIVRFNDTSDRLIENLRQLGPERWLLRKLQRHVVNIPRYLHETLASRGDIEEMHPGIFVQTYPALYHSQLGFLGGEDQYQDPNDYVI